MTQDEAKKIVLEIAHRLSQKKMVLGNGESISQRIDDKLIAITPSNHQFDSLKLEDIAILNLLDLNEEGSCKPCEEKKIHVSLYRADPQINSVIHINQTYVSVYSTLRRAVQVPLCFIPILGEEVPCSYYSFSRSKNLGKQLLKEIRGRSSVLIANHGALYQGKNMEEAFQSTMALEKICEELVHKAFCYLTGESQWSLQCVRDYYVKDQML